MLVSLKKELPVSNLFLTLIIAFVMIVFAIALLAIGWLVTGKTKIEKACGRDPTKKKEESCHTCELCTPPSESTTHVEKKDSKNQSQSE
jgi:hypothetical protein